MKNSAKNKSVLYFSNNGREYSISGDVESIEYIKTIICDDKLNNKKKTIEDIYNDYFFDGKLNNDELIVATNQLINLSTFSDIKKLCNACSDNVHDKYFKLFSKFKELIETEL
jgi:hypothetical protein